jgi:hypothetical protein
MKPEKLILDYSKWRSGGNEENMVGKGEVALLNKEGFMCCLGQWCHQLGISEQLLFQQGEPYELRQKIEHFTYGDEVSFMDEGDYIANTELSTTAIGINDNPDTTPEEKIKELSQLLESEGIELEVINKP